MNTNGNDIKMVALDLLRDCYEDEVAHLELRMIRDAQAPRFEALKETHPEIYRDFLAARTGPHEVLLKNRRKREAMLREMIEATAVRDAPSDLVFVSCRHVKSYLEFPTFPPVPGQHECTSCWRCKTCGEEGCDRPLKGACDER